MEATRAAVHDIQSLKTPATMTDGQADLVSSLTAVGKAMNRRSAALRTRDDQGWSRAQAQLGSASDDYQQAVSSLLG